jgi:hypothetical protein
MGYRARERKRKKNTAQQSAQTESRRSGSAAERWWLTYVRMDCCCARCASILRRGREMVYRHMPRETLCVRCADRERVPYGLSLRAERERRRERQGRLVA